MTEAVAADPSSAACAGFRAVFGRVADGVSFAPGRVNLVGEHTDYNDGFVLPMALERGVAVAFAPGREGLRAHSLAHAESWRASLGDATPPAGGGWPAYVAGVAWSLRESGRRVAPTDLLIASNLPMAAGLSSSAALEVAVARALVEVAGESWKPREIALACQRAEHAFVGVSCGIMDQLTAVLSRPGCALLLDCRSLEAEAVPIPEEAAIALLDTATPRALAESAYNDRWSTCQRALAAIRARFPSVRALRDLDLDRLESCRDLLDEVAGKRARHVVAETGRPAALAAALSSGDLAEAGRVMNDSHASLRDLYEVSSPELDLVTTIAREHPACCGARMTGAGFGGCAVALVRSSGLQEFCRSVGEDYRTRSGRPGAALAVRPGGCVRLERRTG